MAGIRPGRRKIRGNLACVAAGKGVEEKPREAQRQAHGRARRDHRALGTPPGHRGASLRDARGDGGRAEAPPRPTAEVRGHLTVRRRESFDASPTRPPAEVGRGRPGHEPGHGYTGQRDPGHRDRDSAEAPRPPAEVGLGHPHCDRGRRHRSQASRPTAEVGGDRFDRDPGDRDPEATRSPAEVRCDRIGRGPGDRHRSQASWTPAEGRHCRLNGDRGHGHDAEAPRPPAEVGLDRRSNVDHVTFRAGARAT
jgi:hypothetical protein